MAMGNNPIMMIDPDGGWYISTGFDVFTAVSNAAAALGILGFHTLQNRHNPSYKPDWGGVGGNDNSPLMNLYITKTQYVNGQELPSESKSIVYELTITLEKNNKDVILSEGEYYFWENKDAIENPETV